MIDVKFKYGIADLDQLERQLAGHSDIFYIEDDLPKLTRISIIRAKLCDH